ncbi:MAG: Flp pilus assembly complex ATPase component TadA [Firmicutes bacterium]|nr:Flp pilus assembly complex ATPase component TadA [Bacillota bacterium]
MAYKRIGDVLLSAGVITAEDLEKALAIQQNSKHRLGEVLVSEGFVSEAELIEALEIQLGIEFIDLSKASLSPDLARYVPRSLAEKYNAVPVRLQQDELYLAMSDPLNFYAAEDIKKSSHKKIIPMIATADGISRAIHNLYGNEGAARAIEEMIRDASGSYDIESSANITVVDPEDTASAPTVRLVNNIIERAVSERASDIHLEARENDMAVRIRVDGVLRNIFTVPKELSSSVIARMKVMGGMDTSERRVPQDGRANFRKGKDDIDLRISSLPTVFGEKLVIRLLDKNSQILSRKGLGLDDKNIPRFDHLMRNNSGVILITGPTGSGKSSTMNTMIRELNTDDVNLITLEDPVEYNISGVNQVQINEKTGMTFAEGLKASLRQDPDIISVGEIRDAETAEIAMRAAITGHLVLSTLHTGDAISTLDRLKDIGVAPYLTASALRGVIAQRLIKKICPNCKETYEPSDEELDLLHIDRTPGLLFAKGKGCPHCFHTGYRGRTGVFEILLVDKHIRKAVISSEPRETFEALVKEQQFISIADRCRQLVKDGVTTSAEALKTIYSTVE